MSFLSDIWNQQYITKPSPYNGPTPFNYTPPANPFKMSGATTPQTIGMSPYTPVAPQAPVAPTKPIFNQPVPPTQTLGTNNVPPAVDLYAKYRDPKTGNIMTPQEYAVYIANKIPQSGFGDITKYATDSYTNPDQTTKQLQGTAQDLNNARNDLAVGETTMFGGSDKTAGGEKIMYSPTERAAIEKAYAGIYDPALKDVFSKLDVKQKQDAAALDNKTKLEQMAKQHEYNMAEKGLTLGTSGSTGVYVQGANPAVDAWAQRIFDGTAKITDIPAAQKGMRDAVVIALQASGNDLAGKPTVTELGKNALLGAQTLMNKFNSRSGTSAVGGSRFWTTPLSFPGTAKNDFSIDFQNLKDMLSLEGVKYLKGQGQVSDAERALLANATTKLNLSQSEGDFKTTLQGIIDRLSGATAGVIRSPDGTQEATITDLTPAELEEAKAAGWK